jgi:hypothetical protein
MMPLRNNFIIKRTVDYEIRESITEFNAMLGLIIFEEK